MRRLLALLPLCACSFLVTERGPVQCEGAPPFCDENELVFCEQGIEIRQDCGVNGCDPARSVCNGVCGDNLLDPGEECDDGANNSDLSPNACREDCQNPSCGDEVIDNGEDCDPPSTNECDAQCQFIVATCGDGLVQGQEQCDDGNTDNTDSCLNNCELSACGDGFLESGVEECDDQNNINTDFCKSDCTLNICGDAAVFTGIEQCDDGNTTNNDSCSNLCQLPRCGDGIIQGFEECDDGNTSNADSCLNVCVNAACGDGFILSGIEECDDANQNNNDSCLAGCVAATCGDGIVQTSVEECDDGNASNTDSCTTSCVSATCGDGFIESGVEECDDQNTSNNDGCLNTCISATCGDGFTFNQGGNEQCDDANQNNNDSCLDTCQSAICGDGFAAVGVEPCDGSDLGGQSCTSLGFTNGGVLSCNASCQFNTSACVADAGCGDGILQGTEECDDGNQNNNDGCLNTCVSATCGDGFTFNQGGGNEQCDDGNTSNNDGCLNTCVNATCGDGFLRSGVEECDDQNASNDDSCLNTCVNATCGDGFIESGVEECDDQNTSNNDGCLNTCVNATCGDGFTFNQGGDEECDDANTTNNDGCQSDCTVTPIDICGDGQISGVEECDDDDTDSNDGCSNDCTLEADLFVLCDGTVTVGDGSLANPFRTVSEAVTAALAGNVVMILPQSTQSCAGGATIAKNLTLQGLADPTEPGIRPTINGGALEALSFNGIGIKVTVRDLLIRGNRSGSLTSILNSSQVAMLRVDALNSNNNGSVINCNTVSGGKLLFDQSSIHNNPGSGIFVDGSCQAVISNSFFQSNGTLTADREVIKIQNSAARVDIILSTFDDNHSLSNNTVLDGCGNPSKGRIDSSIFNNNHTVADGTVDPIASNCLVTFSDVFGISGVFSGTGNINQNPLFTTLNGVPFHLGAGSPCRNTANPNPLALLFDPIAIFGVDVFGHDFAGNPRFAGTRDMGMFEEP